MTTIAWINGELAVDTRATSYDVANKTLGDTLGDHFMKLLQPFSLTVKGEPVKAIALSGDLALYRFFSFIDLHRETPDHSGKMIKLVKDFYQTSFYDQFAANVVAQSWVIIVTALEVHLLEIHPGDVAAGVAPTYKITTYDKSMPIVAGSSVPEIMRLMENAKLSKEELPMIPRAGRAARVVAAGMTVDKMTGGDILVWDGGCCLKKVDVAVEVEKAKERIAALRASAEVL